jgi:hypothetical protein
MSIENYPVIFKKHYDRDSRSWYVTAFFPTEPFDVQGLQMTCYEHVGQHGGCSFGYFWSGKKCKPEEYADLLTELRGIYETNDDEHVGLKVYTRRSRKMADEFHAAVEKIRKRR